MVVYSILRHKIQDQRSDGAMYEEAKARMTYDPPLTPCALLFALPQPIVCCYVAILYPPAPTKGKSKTPMDLIT